jgi:hypothetical protein
MMDAYFEIMHAFLTGELTEGAATAQFELAGFSYAAEAVGAGAPAVSKAPSFGVYRELVRRQWRSVLDGFFKAAQRFENQTNPQNWEQLANAFHTAHPPRHGNPNRFCEPFGTFLETRSARPELIELVDYATIRHRAMHAPHYPTPKLEQDLFARTYAFDVVAFCELVDDAAGATLPLKAAPTTVLIARSRIDGTLQIVRSSLGALFAVLAAVGEKVPGATVEQTPEANWPPGVTPDLVERERQALVALGLLP